MEILHKDSDVVVINKPSGWIVNSSHTTGTQSVIQEWVYKQPWFNPSADQSDFYLRAGIVHRLDKETSGCLIIALNEPCFLFLQDQFKSRLIKKTYTALVHGAVKKKEGTIEISVGRLPWRRDRFGVLPGGRDSKTEYKVLNYFEKNKEKYTLVEFFPTTGRTHQIRIHSKYIGHPIVSDTFYAGRKTSRNDRKWNQRLFLHASSISFTNPSSGKKISVSAPLPPDLANSLSNLTN